MINIETNEFIPISKPKKCDIYNYQPSGILPNFTRLEDNRLNLILKIKYLYVDEFKGEFKDFWRIIPLSNLIKFIRNESFECQCEILELFENYIYYIDFECNKQKKLWKFSILIRWTLFNHMPKVLSEMLMEDIYQCSIQKDPYIEHLMKWSKAYQTMVARQ